MRYQKVYIALQVMKHDVDGRTDATFSFGHIGGPHYSRDYPDKTFDTEDEAIEWAYEHNKYAEWIIVPKIEFI